MVEQKQYVLKQLKDHILFLQGMKKMKDKSCEVQLGPINESFPEKIFPTGAIHEFLNNSIEGIASTNGFVSCIVSQLMRSAGVCVWLSDSKKVFPPSLQQFAISPDRVVFITINKEKERLWAMEEALKCEGLSSVVCDIKEISFLESRRLQLATEQSRVTGFIIRNTNKQSINACVSRWRIQPLPSELNNHLPGVGFPRWNVELLKIRNGKPGEWQMEFSNNKLYPIDISEKASDYVEERKVV